MTLMSTRWSYAVLAALMIGCGSNPPSGGGGDYDAATDTGGGADVVNPTDVVSQPDVVDAGSRPDVVDAGGGTDVVDGGGGADVVDGGGGMDVVATDGGADVPRTDVVDGGPPSVGCAMPRGTITLPGMNMPIMGTTRGMSTVPSTGCQMNASGPEDSYTLTVTSRTGVILSTENTATSFDSVVSIRRTCTDAMTEVACDDDGGDMPGTSSIARAVLDPGTYSVIVDGYSGGAGNYVLSASAFTPAANGVCAGATALAPGAMLAAQDLAVAGSASTVCNRTGDSGVLYYSVAVPASSRVDVTVTPTMGMTWTPSIRVLDSCTATTCVASRTGTTATTLVNSGTSPRTFVLAVAKSFGNSTGTFAIAATAATMVTPGTDCAVPRTVTPGMDLTAQDTAVGITPSSQCVTSNNGNQLFYQVTVPAGQYARVSATSTGMTARAPVVRVLDSCTATTCADYHTGTTTTDGVAYISNSGTSPRTAVFSVSTTGGATVNGTFTVRAALNPIAAMGAACEAPIVVTPGTMLAGTVTSSGYRPNRNCSGTELGPQIFYSVTVAARNRSRIQVTPAMGAMWTPRLRVLTDCSATACLASPSATMAGGAVETTVVNDTDMPRTYVFSVAATSATATVGAYQVLATNSAVPGYNRTMITGACDDLTMGATAVTPSGGWDDDESSAVAALPFAFRFFGDAVTHYTVTSNGFLQLWPSMTASASSAATNSTIPTAGTPNNYIAPFWDDLLAVTMRTGVRTATLGTGTTRRFVVEWYGWETYPTTMSNLRFQAKLFETTNQIELHYCELTGTNARVHGSSATAGIEDSTGTLGSLASFDTADSIATANAQRFAPR